MIFIYLIYLKSTENCFKKWMKICIVYFIKVVFFVIYCCLFLIALLVNNLRWNALFMKPTDFEKKHYQKLSSVFTCQSKMKKTSKMHNIKDFIKTFIRESVSFWCFTVRIIWQRKVRSCITIPAINTMAINNIILTLTSFRLPIRCEQSLKY